jgi:TrmH family RNA methyltransferase
MPVPSPGWSRLPRVTSERLILSPDNELVRRLRRLAHRRGGEVVLLEGPRVVREAVSCGVPLKVLVLREDVDFEAPAERVVKLGRRAFQSVGQTVTPQGVLALAPRPRRSMGEAVAAAAAAGWPLVVLDGVQDPGNVGAICRTAAAAGAPALAVLEGGADPFGPKAVRASAGNVFRLTVAQGRWDDLAGLGGYGATAAGGTRWDQANLTDTSLIAFGNEARGLSRTDLQPLTIPMAPGVESLNVAAAVAVVLFEICRRVAA